MANALNVSNETIKNLLGSVFEQSGANLGPAELQQHVTRYCKNVADLRRDDRDEKGELYPCPPNLYLIPGATDIDLNCGSLEQYSMLQCSTFNPVPAWKTYSVLQRVFRCFNEEYVIIVDCNPSFSFSTRIALIACEELIVATTFDEFAAGGVQNLLTQLGALGPVEHEISTFRSYLNGFTQKEFDYLQLNPNLPRPDGYAFPLPLAKIRTLVINRFPNRIHDSPPVSMVIEQMMDLMARAYRNNREVFADINTVEGTKASPPPATTDIEAKEIIRTHYFHRVIELKLSLVCAANLGIGVTMLNQKKYRLQIPSYYEEDGQLQAETAAAAVVDANTVMLPESTYYMGNVREDAVKYGLLIQDLVELTLHSSNDPAFRLQGKIVKRVPGAGYGGGGEEDYLKGTINQFIICPQRIPDEFRNTLPSQEEPRAEDRLGRRVLPLERVELNGMIHWWKKDVENTGIVKMLC